MRPLHPAYAIFRRQLLAGTQQTSREWPGRSPEVLTGLCGRRFPLNATGQVVLSLDERLWAAGRMRYVAQRAAR
jgi:hypothetical protein